ncbi:hypothetical protein V5799_021410 [Amblyomma americanum]|uniref:Uncharacterized protein n=1 Tax=Amblyomma americanum TaxID=6943 RepID=A0AAQ4FP15_AMBAM
MAPAQDKGGLYCFTCGNMPCNHFNDFQYGCSRSTKCCVLLVLQLKYALLNFIHLSVNKRPPFPITIPITDSSSYQIWFNRISLFAKSHVMQGRPLAS